VLLLSTQALIGIGYAANAGLGLAPHRAGAWVVLAAIGCAAVLALASAARRPALSPAAGAAALES
jgi:hypothetical protein